MPLKYKNAFISEQGGVKNKIFKPWLKFTIPAQLVRSSQEPVDKPSRTNKTEKQYTCFICPCSVILDTTLRRLSLHVSLPHSETWASFSGLAVVVPVFSHCSGETGAGVLSVQTRVHYDSCGPPPPHTHTPPTSTSLLFSHSPPTAAAQTLTLQLLEEP